jgi:thiamine pyrophosphate-dependent acetolactate synthase large subunit-like protein
MTTDATTATVATAVIRALEANGVTHVFGIPGTHNLELYRALTASSIRHVVPRHEQGAGYAADGFARSSGRPGVVITTSGPAVLNALAAVGTAYADSIPVLVIAPGVPAGYERADFGWLHEVRDQRAAVAGVAARAIRCESAEQAISAVNTAFARWQVDRPRPVYLEIPVDVLESAWRPYPVSPLAPPAPPAAAPGALDEAARLLQRARRPLVIAGGGAWRATAEVALLAEALDAPVLMTTGGKGVLSEDDPRAATTAIATGVGARLLDESDAVIVVGSELADTDLPRRPLLGGPGPGVPLIRIDIDPDQLHKNAPAAVPVLADAASALAALLPRLQPRPPGAGARRAAAARRELRAAARPDGLLALNEALAAALPADTIVAGDSSMVSYLGTAFYWPQQRPRRFLYPNGFSTLGYGLPAAIGAKLAWPGSPVVALVGDGAFLFSAQELVTAAECGLGLPVIVTDNGGYGMIRQQMTERDIPPIAVDLRTPDLPALARALGGAGAAAEDPSEVAALAVKALGDNRPTLIYYRTAP